MTVELNGGGELLHGVRARGQEADDPQARGIGEGLQGGEQVFVHGPLGRDQRDPTRNVQLVGARRLPARSVIPDRIVKP
jgi:hypothetical protein